ncbi:sigma-70 family RNA polymerase sigma factor [Eubacterium sp. An3]|uniref:sigma-70 family RNA polymerase sigma factor n=1 Tax=Eubacterium sp. An3 TaxID=1965628 RepID=UPI000B3A8B93|nr:RNA polymerase subunit sigma-70 [Eubacterium sp. An3]
MKLTQHEKDIVQRKFFTYCIKVLSGEASNYLGELKRLHKKEVTFSELLQKDLNKMYCYDDYEIAEEFSVMGRQIFVYDEWLSEALKKLPIKKREIILMLFFLDMTEKEIAQYLKMVQSTVHYHKKDSLKKLRKYME